MTTDMAVQDQVLQQAADSGRATDTTLAHLTVGEVVIPAEMAQDEEVAQHLLAIFQAFEANIEEFTVGNPANKINPETGYPEFFFGGIFRAIKKVFKKVAPIALPILGSMIPGVGPVLGAALGGAAGGAIGGGGIKGALTGAALGGLGGAITGGAGGLLGSSGGAGSLNGLTGSQMAGLAAKDAATGFSGLGSGIKGVLSGGGLSSLTSGGSGAGLSNLGTVARIGGSLYSGGQDQDALKKAQQQMLTAQGKATSTMQPYNQLGLGAQQQLAGNLSSGFNPGDLTQDPGYQFRLSQGQDALNKKLAAMGMGESGAAVKAASDYGQGMAAQEYGSAYDRWLQQNSQLAGLGAQGQAAAGDLGNIYANTGNVQASGTLAAQERKNKTIADILASLGYA